METSTAPEKERKTAAVQLLERTARNFDRSAIVLLILTWLLVLGALLVTSASRNAPDSFSNAVTFWLLAAGIVLGHIGAICWQRARRCWLDIADERVRDAKAGQSNP